MRTNFVTHTQYPTAIFWNKKNQFMFLILLGTQDVVYNHPRKTIKQTLNVLFFTLINPSPSVSFSFETVIWCVWQTLTKKLLELASPAFQEKVIFPLFNENSLFLVLLYSFIFEAFHLC